MAIIQTTDQIRYLRRKNLEEEARIMGNYYSDIIAQYGIDCVYHKLDMREFTNFKDIIDQNAILKRAYGYNITPTYDVSASMVVFAEVDTDIFNLNKIGYTPNSDITLVFDSTRFACDLAPKIGQYKEYKIDEREIVCEVPKFDSSITSYVNDQGHIVSGYLSSDIWPYELGLGYAETYSCGMLEGKMRCVLSGYEIGKTTTVVCDPYEHTDFRVTFPKNEDLYYSLKHSIENDDYLETMLYLTFKVEEVNIGNGKSKFILTGKTHGSVLFFDLNYLGKYSEKIHPMVGDIVEIDFPDENNREKYEITDCFDKQLTQDGINPLLHKYIWKCKARRYINSHEAGSPDPNEADERLEERRLYDDVIQEETSKSISQYETLDPEKGISEDAAYGGYDGTVDTYDKQSPAKIHQKYEMLQPDNTIDIMRFGCGSRLVTDGYDLYFITSAEFGTDTYVVSKSEHQHVMNTETIFESGLRWLKATDSTLVFVDIEGESQILATDEQFNSSAIEISINDLYNSTVDERYINRNGDNFIKFKGTRTLLFATGDSLYAKLQSNNRTYRII